MAQLLSVIGFALGAAEVVPYLQQFFAPDAKDATTVRVVLGSTEGREDTTSMGGNTPGASLWDFNGNAIGYTAGSSKIRKPQESIDITINPFESVGNVPAEYVSISNGGIDAICIAGLSLTFPDRTVAGFSTNVAAECGAFWANSHTSPIGVAASGQIATPKCVWIDRDGSNGIPHQGMGIHLPSFSNTNENLGTTYTANKDLMCKSGPRFRMYDKLRTEDPILVFPRPPKFILESENPALIGTDEDPGFIIENPGINAASLVDRRGRSLRRHRRHAHYDSLDGPLFSNSTLGTNSTIAASNSTFIASNSTLSVNGTETPSRKPMCERLIISHFAYNSARELCESSTSFGHSFVSTVEELFCDMADKSLYFTCNDKVDTCCFDTLAESFRACQTDSQRPAVSQGNGILGPMNRFRRRSADDALDPAWTKGDKAFDSVQTWS